jgi:hypothetical protein
MICFIAPSSIIFGNINTKNDVLLFPGDFQNLVEDKTGQILSYGIQLNDKIDKLFQLQISKNGNDLFKALTIKDYYISNWDGDKFFGMTKDFKIFVYYSLQQKKILWRKKWINIWKFFNRLPQNSDTKGGITFQIDYGRDGITITHFTSKGTVNFSGQYHVLDQFGKRFYPNPYAKKMNIEELIDDQVIADQEQNCYLLSNIYFATDKKKVEECPFIGKISPKGELIWGRILHDNLLKKQGQKYWILNAYLDQEKLYLVGTTSISEKMVWFSCIDEDGNFLWKKEYELTDNFYPKCITKDNNNHFWISGKFYQKEIRNDFEYSSGECPALIEISPLGEILNSRKYGESLSTFKQLKINNPENDAFGYFDKIFVDSNNNKYVSASILGLPLLCKLDPQGESSVLPSQTIDFRLTRTWNSANQEISKASLVWDTSFVSSRFEIDSDKAPITFSEFKVEPFQSYYLAKDAEENLVIRTDQVNIPLDSLRNILIYSHKKNITGYSYADIQEGIQEYIKQENSYRQEMERRKQEFMKEEWKFHIKLLIAYTTLILLLSCIFFLINRKFGKM